MKTAAASLIVTSPALHLAVVVSSASSCSNMDAPIACTLTGPELAERRTTILNALRAATLRTYRLPNGYAYDFHINPEMPAQLERLIALERQCCQFLTFNIVETPNTIRLEVTGSPEAVAVIEEFFGSADKP